MQAHRRSRHPRFRTDRTSTQVCWRAAVLRRCAVRVTAQAGESHDDGERRGSDNESLTNTVTTTNDVRRRRRTKMMMMMSAGREAFQRNMQRLSRSRAPSDANIISFLKFTESDSTHEICAMAIQVMRYGQVTTHRPEDGRNKAAICSQLKCAVGEVCDVECDVMLLTPRHAI